jgi:hypothetical protein
VTDTDTKKVDGEGADDQSTTGAAGDEGKDFKAEAEKWKALARKHEAQAKSNAEAAKKVQEMEEATKSDIERAMAATTAAETRAAAAEAKALRFEVALAKQVPPKLMKFLTGTTQEEIEASAAELLEAIGPDKGDEAGGKPKPKENLTPGATSEESGDEEKSLEQVLAAIPRAD